MIIQVEPEPQTTITGKFPKTLIVSWKRVQEATNVDKTLSKIRNILQEGSEIDTQSLPDDVKQYTGTLEKMNVQDDVVLYDSRTVIPGKLRNQVVEALYSTHQGCLQMWQ